MEERTSEALLTRAEEKGLLLAVMVVIILAEGDEGGDMDEGDPDEDDVILLACLSNLLPPVPRSLRKEELGSAGERL